MAGKSEEIATDRLDIERPVAGALGGIHEGGNSMLAGARAQFPDRIDGAERVGDMGHGEQLDFFGQPFIETIQVQQPDVTGDREKNKLSARPLGQQLPRDNIAVVLHLGEQDFVAGLDVF